LISKGREGRKDGRKGRGSREGRGVDLLLTEERGRRKWEGSGETGGEGYI